MFNMRMACVDFEYVVSKLQSAVSPDAEAAGVIIDEAIQGVEHNIAGLDFFDMTGLSHMKLIVKYVDHGIEPMIFLASKALCFLGAGCMLTCLNVRERRVIKTTRLESPFYYFVASNDRVISVYETGLTVFSREGSTTYEMRCDDVISTVIPSESVIEIKLVNGEERSLVLGPV